MCHIFVKNHCANMCPDRGESAPEKKADKAEENPKKESSPTNESVNMTIGEDWVYDTDYG